MVSTLILAIIFFSLVLIKAADILIVSLRRIARSTNVGVYTLSALILAIGTSFPELFIGITSAIEKTPSLTFGVVLGSNIANIGLVAGLTAVIAGKVNVVGDIAKRDVFMAFLAAILPLILILDGGLGRVDGMILLSVYFAYAMSFFRGRYKEVGEKQQEEPFFYRLFKRVNHLNEKTTKEYGRFFLGVALLLFSSDMIVKYSTQLAESAGIPIFIVGLIILAVGTSLPEFAFSLKSIEDHHPSMFFGNLLGSTIANSTLILGITSIIHPIRIGGTGGYLVAIMFFLIIFVSFWHFIKTKRSLDRREGLILVLLYVLFIVTQFI